MSSNYRPETLQWFQTVINMVECPVCDSEKEYPCTYLAPKLYHRPTPARLEKILEHTNTQTKAPHMDRRRAYQELLGKVRRDKEYTEQLLLAEQARADGRKRYEIKRLKAKAADSRHRELIAGYQEYGRRESQQLTEWLKKNWQIFRIDEQFD